MKYAYVVSLLLQRAIDDNLYFEQGMIRLANCLPHALPDIEKAFKRWIVTVPYPWQWGLDYCIDRAIRGKSLPFIIEDTKS